VTLETKREFPSRSTILSTTYVDPWVSRLEAPEDITDMVVNILRSRKLPFKQLEEILKKGRRVILIGDPGTGKSTALAKIALDMFRNCLEKRTRGRTEEQLEVPILVKAIEFESRDFGDLLDIHLPPEPLRDRVNIRALLIDGLDEVKIENRRNVMNKAEEFCKNKGCGLIISSRKVEAIKDLLSPFDRYELLPFEYEQASRFIKRLVDDESLIKILDEGLQRDDLKLSLTPMSLELLVEIATVEKEIPASIAEIYERFTDIVMGRYDSTRGIESLFEYFIKKRFLAELAWQQFYLEERLQIPRVDFNRFVEKYMHDYGLDRTKFTEFLSEIDRAGVLRIGDEVVFRHRSFLDYFSALRLNDHLEEHKNIDDDVVRMYFNDMWTDVAFYYVGIRRGTSEAVVDGIDKYRGEQLDSIIQKALIGRLLQAGWHSPSAVKSQAMSVGLQHIQKIRKEMDTLLVSQDKPIPAIVSDFFILLLSEYSFGSRTFLNEVVALCDHFCDENDTDSMLMCLYLLWANRSRLAPDKLHRHVTLALGALAKLEKEGKLSVRDKFVSLFILAQIETEDRKLTKSIRRKMLSVRKNYPSEIRRLLPSPKTGSFRKKRA